jgi:hypothetical protein
MEHIVGLMVNFNKNLVSTPLVTIVLESMALSWAIFDVPVDQTYAPTWEKLVVLDQI